jgi:hypothetical protein
MEIRTKHKLTSMKIGDLAMMKPCLCYNKETNDYEIVIKTNHNAIVITNASNCREICVLRCTADQDVLFAGEISNMDIVNVDF